MWYVTCDMWKFSQKFGSIAHTVLEWMCFEDFKEKDHLFSDKDICRTAPATPGLLIMQQQQKLQHSSINCKIEDNITSTFKATMSHYFWVFLNKDSSVSDVLLT